MKTLQESKISSESRFGQVGLPCLVACGLTLLKSGCHPLRGVSLTVSSGELVGVVGPSDSGKSTLLNVLAGRLEPTFGIFKINETIIGSNRLPRGMVGTAVPEKTMAPDLSGYDWLTSVARHAAPDDPDAALRLFRMPWRMRLSAFGMKALGGYPPGERRLLSLAAASAGRPPVIVLDEPAAGLPGPYLATLCRLIRIWRAEGFAVLVSAKRAEAAALGCHRLYVMDSGTIVARGTHSQVYGADALTTEPLHRHKTGTSKHSM